MLKTLVSCIGPVLMQVAKSKTPSKAASPPVTKQMSAFHFTKEMAKETIGENRNICFAFLPSVHIFD